MRAVLTPAREQAERVREEALRGISAVNRNADLTPAGKRAQREAIVKNANARLRQLRDEHKQALEDHQRELERQAFGIASHEAPEAEIRQARLAAAQLPDAAAALRLLHQAHRDGDEVLQAALYAASHGRWPEVGDAYIEQHPDRAEDLGELADWQAQVGPEQRVGDAIVFRDLSSET